MKPSFYVINGDEVIARVYEKNNKKIVFFLGSTMNLEDGIEFYDSSTEKVENQEIMDLFLDFVRKK